jgi:hemolysin III
MSNELSYSTPNEGRYSLGEEIANSVTHGAGALLSIPALVVMLVESSVKGGAAIVGSALFGASLILLFSMSAIYHGLTAPRAKKVFEILDHSAVYVLIAGTYSAYCLIALRGTTSGTLLLVLVWSLAAAGIAFKSFFVDRFRLAATLGYVVMGWLIAPFVADIRAVLPPRAFTLLFVGGAAYTIGAVVYLFKGFRWIHVLWHLFVLAGAACHVLSILAAMRS